MRVENMKQSALAWDAGKIDGGLRGVASVASGLDRLGDTQQVRVSSKSQVTFSSTVLLREESRRQHRLDGEKPHYNWVTRGLQRMCSESFLQRASNVVKKLTGYEWLPAQRSYDVLPADCVLLNSSGKPHASKMTAERLAMRFKPVLSSISKERVDNPDLQPCEMRFEVLAPSDETPYYTVIYYVKTNDENMPGRILDRLYDAIRPYLFGSKADWEAISIDVDPDTLEAVQMHFETSKVTRDPQSYYANGLHDLHIKTDVTREEMQHSLDAHDNPHLVVTSWNGMFALASSLQEMGYGEKELFALANPPLSFMDIGTFREHSLNLRAPWLLARKHGEV